MGPILSMRISTQNHFDLFPLSCNREMRSSVSRGDRSEKYVVERKSGQGDVVRMRKFISYRSSFRIARETTRIGSLFTGRQSQAPFIPGRIRKLKVGVESECDRHRLFGEVRELHPDFELPVFQPVGHLQSVRKGKLRH